MMVMGCAVCLQTAVNHEISATGSTNISIKVETGSEFKEVEWDAREKKWGIPRAFTTVNGNAVCLSHFLNTRKGL